MRPIPVVADGMALKDQDQRRGEGEENHVDPESHEDLPILGYGEDAMIKQENGDLVDPDRGLVDKLICPGGLVRCEPPSAR